MQAEPRGKCPSISGEAPAGVEDFGLRDALRPPNRVPPEGAPAEQALAVRLLATRWPVLRLPELWARTNPPDRR